MRFQELGPTIFNMIIQIALKASQLVKEDPKDNFTQTLVLALTAPKKQMYS
jgi:hypothetical protein